MINKKNKGLPFPKKEYYKKINLDTNSYLKTEVGTVESTPEFDGYYGLQLEEVPFLKKEERGQTLADPIVKCLDDDTTRIVLYSPNGDEPVVGSVFLDLRTGTIQFNPDDAGKEFEVKYYPKFSLLDHNAMNRIWNAGHTYVVGDDPSHDFDNLEDLVEVLEDGDSIKLMKDVSTEGVIIDKDVILEGNQRKITKVGSSPNSRAISFSSNIVVRNIVFEGWSDTGDVCIFATANKKAIIVQNDSINSLKLTNASEVCDECIVANNLPTDQNVGYTVIEENVSINDKLAKTFTADGAIDLNKPVFLSGNDVSEDSSTGQFVGFSLGTADDNEDVMVVTEGLLDWFSSLIPGQIYYLDSNLDLVAGAGLIKLGKAINTTTINFIQSTCEYTSSIIEVDEAVPYGKAVILFKDSTNGDIVGPMTHTLTGDETKAMFIGLSLGSLNGKCEVVTKGVFPDELGLTSGNIAFINHLGEAVGSDFDVQAISSSTTTNERKILSFGKVLESGILIEKTKITDKVFIRSTAAPYSNTLNSWGRGPANAITGKYFFSLTSLEFLFATEVKNISVQNTVWYATASNPVTRRTKIFLEGCSSLTDGVSDYSSGRYNTQVISGVLNTEMQSVGNGATIINSHVDIASDSSSTNYVDFWGQFTAAGLLTAHSGRIITPVVVPTGWPSNPSNIANWKRMKVRTYVLSCSIFNTNTDVSASEYTNITGCHLHLTIQY